MGKKITTALMADSWCNLQTEIFYTMVKKKQVVKTGLSLVKNLDENIKITNWLLNEDACAVTYKWIFVNVQNILQLGKKKSSRMRKFMQKLKQTNLFLSLPALTNITDEWSL